MFEDVEVLFPRPMFNLVYICTLFYVMRVCIKIDVYYA